MSQYIYVAPTPAWSVGAWVHGFNGPTLDVAPVHLWRIEEEKVSEEMFSSAWPIVCRPDGDYDDSSVRTLLNDGYPLCNPAVIDDASLTAVVEVASTCGARSCSRSTGTP